MHRSALAEGSTLPRRLATETERLLASARVLRHTRNAYNEEQWDEVINDVRAALPAAGGEDTAANAAGTGPAPSDDLGAVVPAARGELRTAASIAVHVHEPFFTSIPPLLCSDRRIYTRV